MHSLQEWAIIYRKHKDVLTKTLKDIQPEKDRVLVNRLDGKKELLVHHENLSKIRNWKEPAAKVYIVTLHNKENLKKLLLSWDEFTSYPNLVVIFVDLTTGQRWCICPYAHQKVLDGPLEQSLRALYENS